MMRPLIKVCGITRLKDARIAIRLGADLLGFIFYRRSPRFISAASAREIIRQIAPTAIRVGVFVNETPNKVIHLARHLQLDLVQLNGDESNREIRHFQREGLGVIKTFHVETRDDFARIGACPAEIMHLDNRTDNSRGGTGERFNWSLRPPRRISNLMLAGGINADNVSEGQRLFRPLIIDVNSGVEYRPGLKSETKLREFFAVVEKIRYGR